MVNDMRVKRAARNETTEARRVIVTCVEKDRSRARNVAAVAVGTAHVRGTKNTVRAGDIRTEWMTCKATAPRWCDDDTGFAYWVGYIYSVSVSW
jgi:hypothetical protein